MKYTYIFLQTKGGLTVGFVAMVFLWPNIPAVDGLISLGRLPPLFTGRADDSPLEPKSDVGTRSGFCTGCFGTIGRWITSGFSPEKKLGSHYFDQQNKA